MAEPHDPNDPFPSCDVCGRTILKGEQIHEYLTPSRERIRVCVLCRSRAESEGWIPATMAHTLDEEQPRRGRGLALRQRFSRAASRARGAARAPAPEPEPEFEPEPIPEPPERTIEPPPVEEPPVAEPVAAKPEPPPEPVPAPGPDAVEEPPPPAKPRAAKPRTRRPSAGGSAAPPRPRAKKGPEALMRRAVERFNSSEERRKVAGLMRSLGEPQAGVQSDPRRQSALVTVGWELSWYQWEVDAEDDRDDPVREIAKGAELNELDDAARAWNALVDEDGSLRLRSAAARRPQEAANEA